MNNYFCIKLIMFDFTYVKHPAYFLQFLYKSCWMPPHLIPWIPIIVLQRLFTVGARIRFDKFLYGVRFPVSSVHVFLVRQLIINY